MTPQEHDTTVMDAYLDTSGCFHVKGPDDSIFFERQTDQQLMRVTREQVLQSDRYRGFQAGYGSNAQCWRKVPRPKVEEGDCALRTLVGIRLGWSFTINQAVSQSDGKNGSGHTASPQ
jgi:hypothetical protein|tara:strand:- start:450 stop:803 length:354 start_codon:yes stop_codon:yes gene_type:complete